MNHSWRNLAMCRRTDRYTHTHTHIRQLMSYELVYTSIHSSIIIIGISCDERKDSLKNVGLLDTLPRWAVECYAASMDCSLLLVYFIPCSRFLSKSFSLLCTFPGTNRLIWPGEYKSRHLSSQSNRFHQWHVF